MIIGLDVGGTHTDVVLLDNQGLVKEIKVYTNSTDLFSTVLEGLRQITQDIDLKTIKRVVLSTTLTTNSIVQGTLPEVGMIVSGGPGIDPMLFKTNSHYYPVSGSIDHRGRRVEAIDHEEIKSLGEKLKDDGVRQLGIVGKFSARNPSHELEIRRILRGQFDDFFLGHRVSGNLNFPRRIATTYLNAAVYPIHKHFFQAVKRSLAQQGLKVPIHILKADGGTMNFESSIHFPGQTILSGPAASVMGATAFAPAEEDILVFDIGGTTTDMAILIDRAPLLDPAGIELGKYKTLIRSLKTRSIGIGGDSVVRFKEGEIEIGPDRSGYAMAYGGTRPTPTDALAVMGKLTDCDRDKAIKGLEPVASEMGISVEEAAQKIFDRACRLILKEANEMVDQINSKPVYTVHELQEGYQVKPKKILVLGGPAPYFAEHLKKISEYAVTVIPSWGVANAIGAALARTTCEVTLFADTERGILTAPEEKFKKNISRDFTKDQAVQQAYELLKQKALQIGANSEDLEMELLEDQVFNMVRGFQTTGRNIRIKAQVKPGLIQRYENVVEKLSLQRDG